MFHCKKFCLSQADNLNFDIAFNATKLRNFLLYDVIISDVITFTHPITNQNFIFVKT